ncbi:MAG: alpha/beta hydrolase [Rubrivivax sp.]|jgi:alpha/beta superfamily hydrolase
MNAHTRQVILQGPAGALQCAVDEPADPPRGLALVCHPHPLHGGTLDNKVVQTLARAFVHLGLRVVRFNFRGVGGSHGAWDEGRGEIDDALAAVQGFREPAQPLVLAGFSFGAYVASQVALRLNGADAVGRVVLVGPAVQSFAVAPVPQDSLVIHGEADEVVSLSSVLNWARPHVIPVTVVPGAGHFFHGQLPLLKSLVLRAGGLAAP